ncbi:PQQ-binding-like beta-propeller repeat protein (plasmid) [Haloferax sp. S1W]|uniref:outer membrane protein assembly factor BamB family protein n=1 Tax=Haloferax sp. S1W TaxID=3377110 RepID=UPI0037CB4097
MADGTVYLQRGVTTHAVSLSTGETRWRVPTGLPSESTPAVTDETVYIARDDTYIRAVATADGTERWRVKTDARIECNLAVVEDTVFAGTDSGDVLALDAATGTERWRSQLAPRQSGDNTRPERPETIATDGSRVYVVTDTTIVVLAAADGTRCWRTRSYQGSYASGVAVGGGNVFVPTNENNAALTAFDAATGDTVQQLVGEDFRHFDIGPSVAEGGLYVAGGNAVARFS